VRVASGKKDEAGAITRVDCNRLDGDKTYSR